MNAHFGVNFMSYLIKILKSRRTLCSTLVSSGKLKHILRTILLAAIG